MKKQKIVKIVLSITMIASLAVGTVNTVRAVPLSVKEQQLQDVQKTINNLEISIQQLDNDITVVDVEISENEDKMNALTTRIEDAKKNLEISNKNLEESKARMDSRVSDMYKNGGDSIITILFSAKGVGDAISKVDTFSKLNALDKKTVKEYNDQVAENKKAAEKLATEKKKLEDLQKSNSTKKEDLNAKKLQAQSLAAQAKAKESDLNSSIDDPLMAPMSVANSPKYTTYSSTIPSSNGNAILETAEKYLNIPYVWGGTTPNPGFDCSGFVQYVFAQNGIHLSRTTYTQINEGVPISLSNVKPGDLIFFGSPSQPYHVGIYCGNGYYIHAPQTGDVIKISALSSSFNYSAARRVY